MEGGRLGGGREEAEGKGVLLVVVVDGEGEKSVGSMSEGSESEPESETSSMRAWRDILRGGLVKAIVDLECLQNYETMYKISEHGGVSQLNDS